MKLKKLFERKKRIALINCDLSLELDKEIEKYVGREVGSFEMEFATDVLNEGIGELSFESFIKKLKEIKNSGQRR